MVDPSRFVPLRVSAFYLLFGFVWILTSDISMVWTGIVDVPAYLFSLCKGMLFVGVSSIIIYVLMRQQLMQISRANSLAHAVVNGTTDAVFVKDRSGRYLMFNSAGGLLVDKRPEDVIGQDDHFVFDAESAAALRDRDQRIMESGLADTAEEVLTINNWTRVFLATKVPYRDESGQVIGLIGISRDITERKRDQERLLETQQRLDHAQLIAKLGSWTWEPNTNRVWWSDAIYNLYGFDPSSTIPSFQNILDRLDPDARRIAIERVDDLMQGGDGFSNEFSGTRTDGSKIWILSVARATRDDQGRLIQVDGFDQDITDRKQIEEELRLSEERLQLALRSAGGGVWDWDLRTDQAWWSPEMYTLWGIDPTEPMALANSLSAIVDQDRDYVRITSQHAIDNRSDYHAEFRINHPDRGECWISSRGRTTSDQDGAIRLIGISQDITDRRRLEEQLRQSQKMEAVGRLAGGVAHDFNNLLTVINGYCRMLVDQISEPSDTRDSLHAIQDAADRATRLTRQLLSFSRQAMIELKVLDLNQVIVQTGAFLSRLVGQDISVELMLAPTACFIEADPIQIDQVILNLTVNARDASDIGSVVTIATRSIEFTSAQQTTTGILSPGKYIELTVSDQGSGIPDAVKTQIFEPFFSTKEREKGTGLGLSVVHGIVTQTGGQIDVESAPGHGASFRIYFKEVSRKVSNVPTLSPAIGTGKERILLVEDEQPIRILCERALSAHGYQVLAAASGSEALELFSKSPEKIDMLVTDLMMPNMSGRELADELRLKKPELLVLYISGYSDDLSIQEGVHSGLDTLLQKPFLPGDLARKVREVLDGPDQEFAPHDDYVSPS
jgi:PAS domain S-box-containing protein